MNPMAIQEGRVMPEVAEPSVEDREARLGEFLDGCNDLLDEFVGQVAQVGEPYREIASVVALLRLDRVAVLLGRETENLLTTPRPASVTDAIQDAMDSVVRIFNILHPRVPITVKVGR